MFSNCSMRVSGPRRFDQPRASETKNNRRKCHLHRSKKGEKSQKHQARFGTSVIFSRGQHDDAGGEAGGGGVRRRRIKALSSCGRDFLPVTRPFTAKIIKIAQSGPCSPKFLRRNQRDIAANSLSKLAGKIFCASGKERGASSQQVSVHSLHDCSQCGCCGFALWVSEPKENSECAIAVSD